MVLRTLGGEVDAMIDSAIRRRPYLAAQSATIRATNELFFKMSCNRRTEWFDRAGVGAYFATDFESFGFINVNGINVGAATDFPDRYRNLKAQLYWSLRERFQNGEVSGLDDEVSIAQLASIRYEINPRGQVQIESKEEARKRGVRSPDRAEALMLAFADRTPGILRYYQEQAEAQAARAKNPDMPEPEPDDYLEQIYVAEQRRLEALEK
jgi:hypothetical protein